MTSSWDKVLKARLQRWVIQCTPSANGVYLLWICNVTPVFGPWKVLTPFAPMHNKVLAKASLSILAAPLKASMITLVRLSEPDPSTTFSSEIKKRNTTPILDHIGMDRYPWPIVNGANFITCECHIVSSSKDSWNGSPHFKIHKLSHSPTRVVWSMHPREIWHIQKLIQGYPTLILQHRTTISQNLEQGCELDFFLLPF